jgi:eukaryotic-like serine/threonine-protein kinase
MASVLLCEDERLGRQVAVKRLHADSPVDVERRFNREAKLGASLNHPNLVSVFDTATDDEGVLIVMEYVDGEPLSRVLRRGPLRPEEVCRVVRDVAAALDHAHAEGVVHRDVKPGNVLIRHDGVSKLVDLGIAIASDASRITRSGTVLGTAAYMAPEQLEGRDAGPEADIYSLAAIAYEALSGKKPREGRTPMEIAHRVATEGPPDLRDAWPRAPKSAARVLQRGMARNPQARPASAGELARELADALEERPEERTRTTRLLRRRAAAGVAAAPAAAAAGTGAAAAGAGAAGAAAGAPARGADRTPTPASTLPPPIHGGARRRRPGLVPVLLAIVLIGLAAAAIVGAVLSGGDDKSASPRSEQTRSAPAKQEPARNQPAQNEPAQKESTGKKKEPKGKGPKKDPAAQSGATYDPARGAALNDQGFILMNNGDYEEAIPILRQAVDLFPPTTTDLTYAYALYNLGRSLRLAGRPDEAIPILEKRLTIDNQTETVQRELDLARQAAGQT